MEWNVCQILRNKISSNLRVFFSISEQNLIIVDMSDGLLMVIC